MDAREFERIPRKKRIIGRQTLMVEGTPVYVLTEWDGKDMSNGESPVPLPFSTYIHSQRFPNILTAYASQKHAEVGHHLAVGFVKSQGGKAGFPVFLSVIATAFTRPRSIKHGWFMVALFSIVVAMQLPSLVMSLVFWNWDWSDLFAGAVTAAYGYALFRSAQGLKRLRAERKEEKRVEREKKAFDDIVVREWT